MSAAAADAAVESAVPVAEPRISVVTPSWNQGRFIERCIRSVLDQNYANFEHIVQDNCSTDETHVVLRRYPHVRWVSAPDCGQSDALNRALARATGEIIAWINTDDAYEPGAFARVARELSGPQAASVVNGALRVCDADGRALRMIQPRFAGLAGIVRFWDGGHGLTQPSMFFRRQVLNTVGRLDPSLNFAMDYDLWLRIAARYPIRTIDAVLATFRIHPASKTGQARFERGFREEVYRCSRRYWRLAGGRNAAHWARECHAYLANLVTHDLLAGQRETGRVDWHAVRQLAALRPAALSQRHLLAAVGESLIGARRWAVLKRSLGYRPAAASQ